MYFILSQVIYINIYRSLGYVKFHMQYLLYERPPYSSSSRSSEYHHRRNILPRYLRASLGKWKSRSFGNRRERILYTPGSPHLPLRSSTLSCVYEQRTRWKFSDHVQKHISTLHNSFLDISAQFSIPVAIASVIRYYQKAPFYELAFLRTLTTMQFLSLLATSVTTGLFEDDYHRRPKRVVIIVLYGLLEFGFYMGLIGSLVASQVTWETVSELSEACKTYGKIFPWIKHLSPPSKIHLPHLPTKSNDLKTWKVHLVYTLVAIAGLVGLVLAFFVIRFTIRTLGRILRGRKDWRPFVIPMSSAFTIAMIVEVVEMERLRDVMKTITGADFQDNQWGFGQVIALFLWVPLCSQFAYYILR